MSFFPFGRYFKIGFLLLIFFTSFSGVFLQVSLTSHLSFHFLNIFRCYSLPSLWLTTPPITKRFACFPSNDSSIGKTWELSLSPPSNWFFSLSLSISFHTDQFYLLLCYNYIYFHIFKYPAFSLSHLFRSTKRPLLLFIIRSTQPHSYRRERRLCFGCSVGFMRSLSSYCLPTSSSLSSYGEY